MEAFILAFDTGTAPAVGYQATMDGASVGSPELALDLDLLEGQAVALNAELIAKGTLDGDPRGLLYAPGAGHYEADDPALGPFTRAELLAQVTAGDAVWTFTGVYPGTGARMGLDRDLDLVPDGPDGATSYGSSTPGCNGDLVLWANSDAEVGHGGFALVCEGPVPGAFGLLGPGLPAGLPPAVRRHRARRPERAAVRAPPHAGRGRTGAAHAPHPARPDARRRHALRAGDLQRPLRSLPRRGFAGARVHGRPLAPGPGRPKNVRTGDQERSRRCRLTRAIPVDYPGGGR